MSEFKICLCPMKEMALRHPRPIFTNGAFTDIWDVSFRVGLVGRCPQFCHSRCINDAFIDPRPYGSSYRAPLVPNIHIYPSLRFHKLIWNGSDLFGITKMIDFKLKQAFIDIKLSFSDGSATKIHVYIQLVLGRYFGSVSEITHSRSPPEYQRNSVALELVRRR